VAKFIRNLKKFQSHDNVCQMALSRNKVKCASGQCYTLGWIQDFTEGGSILGPPKAVPCRGVLGHPPPENFEIQVLGNAILRPSHGVLRSRFFRPKCHSY